MLVRGFPAQAFDTNCYVVAPGPGEQCVVVDPGIGVEEQLDELLREHGLQPVAVLLTHGHLDHTFSVTPVCGARGIPACIHPRRPRPARRPGEVPVAQAGQPVRRPAGVDRARRRRACSTRPSRSSSPACASASTSRPATRRARWSSGCPATRPAARRRAPLLLSGDVLFAGSIGRTDLPGGSWEQMQALAGRA